MNQPQRRQPVHPRDPGTQADAAAADTPRGAASQRLASMHAGWETWWQGRAARERLAVKLAAVLLGASVFWLLLVAPAWRTLQRSDAERARLDAQLVEMQTLAEEATQLRAAPAVPADQAAAALKTAVARMGNQASLTLQGDRAVLTLQGLSLEALGPWLQELSTGARVRPLEMNLTRGAAGYSGKLVLALPVQP